MCWVHTTEPVGVRHPLLSLPLLSLLLLSLLLLSLLLLAVPAGFLASPTDSRSAYGTRPESSTRPGPTPCFSATTSWPI